MHNSGRFSDDSSFRRAVEDVFASLLEQIDELDGELDARHIPGGLTVVFEALGSTFVLSQQTPTHEIWLSANLRAWHFRFVDGTWVERDTTVPLLPLLSGLFSEKLGTSVEFRG